jgi:hypothetical protein
VATNPLGKFDNHYIGGPERVDNVLRPGGQKVDYSYYGLRGDQRLSKIRNLGPAGSPLSKFNSRYDVNGNILRWQQQIGSQPPRHYELGYDRAAQLINASLREATDAAAARSASRAR